MNLFSKIIHTTSLLGPKRMAQFVAKRLRGPNPIRLWETDRDFLARAKEIETHTLVDRQRMFILYQLVQQSRSIDGEVAEVGVYRGGTAKLISKLAAQKT